MSTSLERRNRLNLEGWLCWAAVVVAVAIGISMLPDSSGLGATNHRVLDAFAEVGASGIDFLRHDTAVSELELIQRGQDAGVIIHGSYDRHLGVYNGVWETFTGGLQFSGK